MLKIAKKKHNLALGGQFRLQSDFFFEVPPIRLRPRRGRKILSPPPSKV